MPLEGCSLAKLASCFCCSRGHGVPQTFYENTSTAYYVTCFCSTLPQAPASVLSALSTHWMKNEVLGADGGIVVGAEILEAHDILTAEVCL